MAHSGESLRRRPLADPIFAPAATIEADKGAAALGTAASIGALFSAAACCVLPLGLAAAGLGAGGLAALVPFHWPLTIAAIIAIAAAWLLYLRKKRACSRDTDCTTSPPSRATLLMLCLSTLFVIVSASWSFIEAPLMRLLGGA